MLYAKSISGLSAREAPDRKIRRRLSIEVRRLENDLATAAEKTITSHRNVTSLEV